MFSDNKEGLMKTKFVNTIVIGEEILEQAFCVKKAGPVKDGRAELILSDKTGEIKASIPLQEADRLSDYVNKIIKVSGVILNEKRTPYIKVKSVVLAQPCDYRSIDIFNGLTHEKMEYYISDIIELKEHVNHAGYRRLLDAALTDEVLKKLGASPATHDYYGIYVGGALAATDAVTRMVVSSMASYVGRGNGVTTKPPEWDVLITASLLHTYGLIKYYDSEDAFKKSPIGIATDYYSSLQSSIEEIIWKNNIRITEQEIANLLNILNVAVSGKTGTKAVSKNGTILRGILSLYAKCDAIDWELANCGTEENKVFYYSAKFRQYLMLEGGA